MAEKHLADLVVELQARGDKFEAALTRLEGQLGKTKTSVDSLTSSVQGKFDALTGTIGKVQGAFAALSAVAGLGGLAAMAKQAVSAADDLGDMAEALGISTDHLQELQYAAKQMGSSSETMTAGIAKFQKTLADAIGGSREASDLFEQLGLNARELASLPLPEAMGKFADAIQNTSNQTQQLDFTTAAFGKGAVSLTAVLKQGGDALTEMRQEAHETGSVMQGELIASAGDLQNEFQKASGAITTQMQSALINIAPLLTSSAGLFATLAQQVGAATDKFFGFTSAGIKAALAEVNAEIETTKQALASAASDIPSLFSAEGLKRVGKSMLGGEGGLIDIPETELLTQKLATLEGQAASLQGKLLAVGQAATSAGQGVGEGFVPPVDHAKSAAEKAADALGKVQDAMREEIATLTQQNAILAQVQAGTLSYAEGMQQLQVATSNAKVQDDALAEAHARLTARNTDLKASIEAARERWEEYSQALQKSRDAISDSLTAFEDQTQEYQRQSVEIQKGIDLGLTWEQVQRNIAESAIAAKEATGEYNQEQAQLARQALAAKGGVEDLTDSFNKARDASRDWALSTKDLETVITGILQGTQDIGSIFEDLGQTMGIRLVKGILFGKGSVEQKILGNFNELLGIDAAGIFGKEGLNLGGDLIGGILNSVGSGASSLLSALGIDVGSLFGSSAVDAGSVAWESGWNGIFNGSGAGSILNSAGQAGSIFGATFGQLAGAAAVAYMANQIGNGIAKAIGVGQTKEGQIAGTVASVLFSPLLGPIIGGWIGDLFHHIPTKGSQIRAGAADWLDEIGVSFADQIKSSKYFFKPTKALAEAMFGGDFLAASKQILTEHAGPELARQFQAVGAFVTAEQAKKLGKPLEQTATTFGNMIVANLGDDADLQGALNEIVSKAQITFEGLVTALNSAFEENAVGAEFYKDAILGTVDLFTQDLPKGINASKIALKSFTDDGIFSLSQFETSLSAIVNQIAGTQQAVASLISAGLSSGMSAGDLGNQFATDTLPNVLREGLINSLLGEKLPTLFEGLDLSAPIAAGSAEAETLKTRVQEIYQSILDMLEAAGLLPESFKEVDESVALAAKNLEKAKAAANNLTEAFRRTGSTLASKMLDSLRNGKVLDQSELFATVQQGMAEAVLNGIIEGLVNTAIIDPIIETLFGPVHDAMVSALSDGVLSAEEIATLLAAGSAAMAAVPDALAAGAQIWSQIANDPNFKSLVDIIKGDGAGTSGGGSSGGGGGTPVGGTGGRPGQWAARQKRLDDLLGSVSAFVSEAQEADPLAAIRADYQALVDQVTKNRNQLEKAGHDVDMVLANLASALSVKLAEAADQGGDSISSLVDELRAGAHELRFGLLTNESQMGDVQGRFNAALLLAQGGNVDAARNALDLGRQLVDVTRSAYASSPVTASTVEVVARALDSLADQFGSSLTTDTGAQAVSELQEINSTLSDMAANARQPVTIQIVDESGSVQMERTFNELLYRSEQGKIMLDLRGVRGKR